MATGTDDSRTCAVAECDKGPILQTDGRVDARAFAVPRNERSGFRVNWDDAGFASFHEHCWFDLIKSAREKDSRLTMTETEMVKEAVKTAEIHDSLDRLKREAEHIAHLIKNSKYCMAFTGAGISTAAGIGDFRGIHGKWTERDKKKTYGAKGTKKTPPRNMQVLRPTYTHEAIVKLLEKDHIKYLISQNVDGLHRLSGVGEGQISELHGNTFVEKCEKCNKRYVRNFRCGGKATNVPVNKCKHCRINHRTGRVCDDQKCKGYLMNTIINFGDYLEEDVINSAEEHAAKSDLVLALGTTLQVSPANSLVESGQTPTRLVICNRQVTDYDQTCLKLDEKGETLGSRVFGDCDKLMREVMRRILPEEERVKWEEDRSVRMLTYDTQRKL
uniref:protein acetyllysine N-acetyltransferase n=1 Tax=Crassostrea virginica TaxID=6565 RepID=A0A8B8CP26_CRAVI|nr:NAD-dependent protein deacetylase Sirt6-like [Crassostrea virginica]XP_022316151.1 NAD-dependent protein deacetylase Sirt6-like [Crassostrea virginica]